MVGAEFEAELVVEVDMSVELLSEEDDVEEAVSVSVTALS